jgi:hypothetical protein
MLCEKRKPLPCRRRLAATLPEILVAVTVTSFLFGVLGVTTHTLFRAQRSTRAEVDFRRTLSGLSVQLREDAHAAIILEAESPTTAKGTAQRTFILADARRVRYRVDPQAPAIERTRLEDGVEVGRQTYLLPLHATAGFGADDPQRPGIVTLTIARPLSRHAADGQQVVKIEAAVGLHRPPSRTSAGDGRESE